MANLPAVLTIKPGTYVTVRLNQPLSSDRNQVGDGFSATLVRPIIVDGVVVAERGQTLGGRVTEAKKAGRVSGTSRLGIQLTDLPVVDGSQVPMQTSLVNRNGPTTQGRDAAAIAGTTGFGAAVGAAAGWGTGAAIGAGAGFVAATLGVLLTRGVPTIIPTEATLTFRVEQGVTISTAHAPFTFRFAEPQDLQPQNNGGQQHLQTRAPAQGFPPSSFGPPAFYGPPVFPAYAPFPFWGPSVYFGFGGFYGPRYYRRW